MKNKRSSHNTGGLCEEKNYARSPTIRVQPVRAVIWFQEAPQTAARRCPKSSCSKNVSKSSSKPLQWRPFLVK